MDATKKQLVTVSNPQGENFSLDKNFAEKISPTTSIGEIGENFLLAKISAYIRYYDWGSNQHSYLYEYG